MRAALVDASGLIVNAIVVDEGTHYVPPEGLVLVFDPTAAAELGGSWDGKMFYPPPSLTLSAPAVPTKEQLLAQLSALQAQIEAMVG